MATLHIIGTPIGNLEDITLRALRMLGEVDVILCEDTRVTAKLLKHYNLSKPLKAYHEHSPLPDLSQYENVAYVSDAGTPGVSDPGAALVAHARSEGWNVVAVPGPSALAALISISGQDVSEFTYLGFPPHKKGRETFFKAVADSLSGESAKSVRPVIFYEAPTRVKKALEQLAKFAPEANLVIGRELTKKFEEVISGSVSELSSYFAKNPTKLRGEFVILVS